MADVETAPQWAQRSPQWEQRGRRDTERVMYYRLKSGWIAGSDTQPSKFITMTRKGAVLLPQFPPITDSKDYWGPILRHPDGPEAFPVDQIIAYGWYRPENVPVKGIRFPQLKGQKIVEYPCPENCRRVFLNPIHLASHMRIIHDYQRHEIIAYGVAAGIDFSKLPGGRETMTFDYTDEPAIEAVAPVEEPDFELEIVSPETPAEEPIDAEAFVERVKCDECDWKAAEDIKRPETALQLHKRVKHPQAVVA